MKRSRFASLYLNKLSQLYVITSDTDPCEDADHVNEFSILNNDLRRLGKSEFLTQCHVSLGGRPGARGVTPASAALTVCFEQRQKRSLHLAKTPLRRSPAAQTATKGQICCTRNTAHSDHRLFRAGSPPIKIPRKPQLVGAWPCVSRGLGPAWAADKSLMSSGEARRWEREL